MTSKAPSKTTQVTEVKLPQWVEDAAKSNVEFANEIASREYDPYTGQRVAGTSAGTNKAYGYLNSAIDQGGAGAASYASSTKALDDLLANPITASKVKSSNVTADKVKAGMITDLNRDAYMNPFIENVEEKALGALDRSRVQSLMQNSEKAKQASAFGGSRSAIVDAVTNAEAANNAGLLSAGLRKEAFDTASGLMTSDLNRKLTADTGNADRRLAADSGNADRKLRADTSNQSAQLGADTANASNRLSAASQYKGIGDSQQAAMAQNYGMLSQAGIQQQMQQQRELDAAYAAWEDEKNFDIENLNLRLSALGMSPYGKSETGVKTTEGGSSGTDFAQLGLGVLSLMFGLSDRRVKKDIKKIRDNGKIPIYEYRYKGESKRMPKLRGPMAQDVEKVLPGSVREFGGMKMVDKRVLGALSA